MVDVDSLRSPQADGGEAVRVTPRGGSVALPSWSPAGGTIAYLGYADAEDAPRNSRLWLVSAEGARLAV